MKLVGKETVHLEREVPRPVEYDAAGHVIPNTKVPKRVSSRESFVLTKQLITLAGALLVIDYGYLETSIGDSLHRVVRGLRPDTSPRSAMPSVSAIDHLALSAGTRNSEPLLQHRTSNTRFLFPVS